MSQHSEALLGALRHGRQQLPPEIYSLEDLGIPLPFVAESQVTKETATYLDRYMRIAKNLPPGLCTTISNSYETRNSADNTAKFIRHPTRGEFTGAEIFGAKAVRDRRLGALEGYWTVVIWSIFPQLQTEQESE
jgi:hypothetical protein